MEKLYTRKEAAEILGISIAKLDYERADGHIAYVQRVANGRVFFTDAALQEYVARLTRRARPLETRSSVSRMRKTGRR